jgi:NAD dependent epimerase/dehydratase family enzyme
VLLRTAVVMSPQAGGAFDILRGLARRGLGGAQGNGRQFVSWVHEADFVRAVAFAIAREDLGDVINIASPHPVRNRSFMAALRQACGAPIGLPTPAWLLELGACFLRTETELVLKSRRVVPQRLLDAGFTFLHADWPEAAHDLCGSMGQRRRHRPAVAAIRST